jgi:Tol biopolymer transport system component
MGKKMSVITRFAILLLLPLTGCLDQGTGMPGSQSRPTTGADPLPRVVDNHPGENHFANIIQLTDGAENAEAYWSYNSQQFIFQSNRPPHSCDQIYTMDIDGGNLQQISSGDGRTTCAYFLSPDDSTVLWASTHLGSEECPPEPDRSQGYVWPIYSSYDVFTKKLPDGEVVRLTTDPGYDAEATVSPDGSRIVFTSMRDGDLDIYTMAPDGSDVVRLTSTPGYDGGPFFSPDGTKICYRARHPQGEELAEYQRLLKDGLVRPSRMDLFVMNSDGSGVFRITDNNAANFAPFFTPDGKSLLFSSNQGAGGGREFDIYKINIDGTGQEQVTTSPGFDGFPMISPDGSRILFCSNRHNSNEGETNVFVADWLGGE